MSAPAAKAFSEPVRTMALVEESASRAVRAVLSSVKRDVERAFRARGRLSVTAEGLGISKRSVEWNWIGR